MTYAIKIKKILAKAEATDNEAEASSFMEKVNELLREHNISLMDVRRLDEEDKVVGKKGANEFWASHGYGKRLAGALGAYYGVKIITSTTADRKVYLSVFGRESAVTTFDLMFDYLMREIARLATKGKNEGKFRTRTIGLTAVGNALTVRLSKLAFKQKEETPKHVQNALVPVDEIDAKINEMFKRLGKARQSRAPLKTTQEAIKMAAGISLADQIDKGDKLSIEDKSK